MTALLCLDLGTSAAKAALIDLDGEVHGQASHEYSTRTTPDGGAEQDPADWVRAARSALASALAAHPVGSQPAALSLTGQMQDLVLEVSAGPQPPAVLYSDTRAREDAEQIREAVPEWDRITGNQQDATSCAAMFRRLTRTAPDVVEHAEAIAFGPAGHLAHLLGCGSWCDPTTASTTGLLDIGTRTWSNRIAQAAGIERDLLPRLTGSIGQVVGRTDERAADLLGLLSGIPIVLAPGDAGATTLGIVGLAPGADYAYLGSSGWLASVHPMQDVASRRSDHHSTTTASHRLELAPPPAAVGADPGSARTAEGGAVLLISALLAAGTAADSARTTYLNGATTAQADAQLQERSRERGRGPSGMLALPSILGERFPVRDPDLRGAIIGIGLDHRGIDLYAAALEGVAHALAHAMDEHHPPTTASTTPDLAPAGRQTAAPLAVTGGGATSAAWRQILADVTGRPVRMVDSTDAALLGSAIAAADALGLDHNLQPLASRPDGRHVNPDPAAAAAYSAVRPAHRALYDAVAGVHARIGASGPARP